MFLRTSTFLEFFRIGNQPSTPGFPPTQQPMEAPQSASARSTGQPDSGKFIHFLICVKSKFFPTLSVIKS